jgi:hypothetical protein
LDDFQIFALDADGSVIAALVTSTDVLGTVLPNTKPNEASSRNISGNFAGKRAATDQRIAS